MVVVLIHFESLKGHWLEGLGRVDLGQSHRDKRQARRREIFPVQHDGGKGCTIMTIESLRLTYIPEIPSIPELKE